MPTPFPLRPFVSLVLATFNRGSVLIDCLGKTLAAAYGALGEGRFDIHVVDNASTDNSPALLAGFAASHPQIKLHRLAKNCGPVAKNVALCDNPADILVLLDDDAYPQPGALAQMVRHFQDDANLGAAVFDVTLPHGRKEASAYPDVFIGAGTAIRGAALRGLPNTGRPGRHLLPADFFMQAEEYDLSFRLLAAGWSVQRFWDMPLMHLKAPGARIGQRTTRLDVRNNLWLLARYLPEPLCTEFAADWLARYWRMAVARDAAGDGKSHKGAFLRGAAEGLGHWRRQRGTSLLGAETIERIFKFETIWQRLGRAKAQHGLQRIAFGDWGKNLLAFHRAARDLDLEVVAVVDGSNPPKGGTTNSEYRGIPVVDEGTFVREYAPGVDAVVLSQMSRVHAERRAADLRRTVQTPVLDLFSPTQTARTAPFQSAGAG